MLLGGRDRGTRGSRRTVEVDGKLVGEPAAEVLGRGRHLLLHDAVVLLLLRRSLEALPRERAAQKVHEHVAERLHVVAAGLLCSSFRGASADVPHRAASDDQTGGKAYRRRGAC